MRSGNEVVMCYCSISLISYTHVCTHTYTQSLNTCIHTHTNTHTHTHQENRSKDTVLLVDRYKYLGLMPCSEMELKMMGHPVSQVDKCKRLQGYVCQSLYTYMYLLAAVHICTQGVLPKHGSYVEW